VSASPAAPAVPAADRRQSVQSIEVGLRLLDVMADAGMPLALKDISQRSGIPPSQAHRYLRSFINGRMVMQDPASGRYVLGPMAIRVGLAALHQLDGIEACDIAVRELALTWDYAGGVAVWTERGPIMVRWHQGNSFFIPAVGLGTTFPLLGSAVGRVFLACLAPTRTAELLENELRQPVSRFAETTPAEVGVLRNQVREQGYSQIVDHFTPLIRGIAAPVFDLQGHVQAVISIAGRIPPSKTEDPIRDDLLARARAVSNDLGYAPGRPPSLDA